LNTTVAIITVAIVLARIVDVSLDTLRTAAIVQGRRVYAACLGFVEAMVYICAIAKVLQDLSHPSYLVAYASGFALGTYLGIAIEQRLAFGIQVASFFTRKGAELGKALASAGHRLVRVEGHVYNGDLAILHLSVPRKRMRKLIHEAVAIDETCFCVVNDVRVAGFVAHKEISHRHPRQIKALEPVRSITGTVQQ
jgi:uncharacterized protein YebE (UPF0316 family)